APPCRPVRAGGSRPSVARSLPAPRGGAVARPAAEATRRGRPPVSERGRFVLDVLVDARGLDRALARDVRHGLTATPKTLPPKYFYDAAGSRLFERITELPEYYLTRAEAEIVERIVPELLPVLAPPDIVET